MASPEKKRKNAISRVPCLVQIYGDCINKRYRLLSPSITIGRSLSSTIKLDSIHVSRKHCILTCSDGKWIVKDNRSENGTFVNCRRLEQNQAYRLQIGDIVYLGPPSEKPQAFVFDDFIVEEELNAANTVDAKDAESADDIVIMLDDDDVCSSSKSVHPKQDRGKKATHEDSQVEEISQSLLDAESVDVLSQDPYPFSLRLEDSTSRNNSLLKVEASSYPKPADCSQKSDSEALKSKLAVLSEEINKLEKSKSMLLQEYKAEREKNKLLDQKLTEQQKSKEIKTQIMEIMEQEAICHICTEVLIMPTVLGCSHTFCEHCITVWKKTKAQCPICRNNITSQTRILGLDHFIDKTLETLTPDEKERRNQLILERERLKNMPKPVRTPKSRRRRRITRRTAIPERYGTHTVAGSTISQRVSRMLSDTATAQHVLPLTHMSVQPVPFRRNIGIRFQGLYPTPVVEIDISNTPRVVQTSLRSARRAMVPDILLSSDDSDNT